LWIGYYIDPLAARPSARVGFLAFYRSLQRLPFRMEGTVTDRWAVGTGHWLLVQRNLVVISEGEP